MYMHQWGGEGLPAQAGVWFINMPLWVPWFLALLVPFILLFIAWSVVWKGLALWHSARRGQYWWFMILLVVNTLGILEIIYLFAVAKLRFKDLFSKNSHPHHSHHSHHN